MESMMDPALKVFEDHIPLIFEQEVLSQDFDRAHQTIRHAQCTMISPSKETQAKFWQFYGRFCMRAGDRLMAAHIALSDSLSLHWSIDTLLDLISVDLVRGQMRDAYSRLSEAYSKGIPSEFEPLMELIRSVLTAQVSSDPTQHDKLICEALFGSPVTDNSSPIDQDSVQRAIGVLRRLITEYRMYDLLPMIKKHLKSTQLESLKDELILWECQAAVSKKNFKSAVTMLGDRFADLTDPPQTITTSKDGATKLTVDTSHIDNTFSHISTPLSNKENIIDSATSTPLMSPSLSPLAAAPVAGIVPPQPLTSLKIPPLSDKPLDNPSSPTLKRVSKQQPLSRGSSSLRRGNSNIFSKRSSAMQSAQGTPRASTQRNDSTTSITFTSLMSCVKNMSREFLLVLGDCALGLKMYNFVLEVNMEICSRLGNAGGIGAGICQNSDSGNSQSNLAVNDRVQAVNDRPVHPADSVVEDIPQTISEYYESLISKSQGIFILSRLGECSLKLAKPENAMNFFSQGLTKYPNLAILHNGLSAAYLMIENYKCAFNHACKATQADPLLIDSWAYSSIAALKLGLIDIARSSFTAFRDSTRQSANHVSTSIIMQLGFAWSALGNSEGAAKVEVCAQLAALNGAPQAKVQWLLAEAMVCMKDEKAHQKLLDTAVMFSKAGDDLEAQINKMKVLERLMAIAHGNDQLLRTIRPALIKLAPQLLSKPHM